jgi:hypothetical protein
MHAGTKPLLLTRQGEEKDRDCADASRIGEIDTTGMSDSKGR